MYTIDRLNALREHYGLIPYLVPSDLWKTDREDTIYGSTHLYLDELDRCADIHTAWSDGHKCSHNWHCASDHRQPNLVGARLALHEQHLKKRKEPERRPYFWLGAEAEWCNAV